MVRLTQDSVESEAILLGSNDDYKVYESPTGELVVEDVNNQTRGYIKPEVNGEIGGDGRLVTALKNEEPMADDGETYPTIQAAENAASSWVFVPPGTYNESVNINTEGLTLKGSGYSTQIVSDSGNAISLDSKATVRDLRVNAQGTNNGIAGDEGIVINCVAEEPGEYGIGVGAGLIQNCRVDGTNGASGAKNIGLFGDGPGPIIVVNSISKNSQEQGIQTFGATTPSVVANNIVTGSASSGLEMNGDDTVIIGNRVINSGGNGINIGGDNNIIANNRSSDSTNSDVNDFGSGNTLDSNLTGASN